MFQKKCVSLRYKLRSKPKPETKQHQDYDKILQETVSRVAPSLVEKLCGIKAERWENVSAKLPRTIERRADWLKIGYDTLTGQKRAYHLEFQSGNDPKMPNRMLLYYLLIGEEHQCEVVQFVVFLGEGKCTMPNFIKTDTLNFRFSVVSINTIDYKIFVESAAPEEIILAILADLKGGDKAKIVDEIVLALTQHTDPSEITKFVFQLEILAHLRNTQPLVTQKIERMSLNYNLKTDVRYLQGEQIGIAIGEQKGIAIGEQKGLLLTAKIIKLYLRGLSIAEIVEKLATDATTVSTAIAEYEAE